MGLKGRDILSSVTALELLGTGRCRPLNFCSAADGQFPNNFVVTYQVSIRKSSHSNKKRLFFLLGKCLLIFFQQFSLIYFADTDVNDYWEKNGMD